MGGRASAWSSCPGDTSPLVRTDFSSDVVWRRLVAAATAPTPEGFTANIHFIDEPLFDGAAPHALCREMSVRLGASLLIVADQKTMIHDEMPLLCLSAHEQDAWVRTIPSKLWSIENNIRLANMDFSEFVESADADGVYRGFE